MKLLWAFLQRDIRNEVSYSLSFFLQMLGIFPIVLLFFFLARLFGDSVPVALNRYGGQYFPFVLIGVAVQSYLTAGLGSFASSMRQAQLSGTLEAVLATPVPIPMFLLGSALYAFLLNSLRIVLYLVFGSLLSDIGIELCRIPAAALIMGLTIAAFSSLGILSASFIMLFKKGDPLNWMFSVASWFLGGVYYPVSVLPEWLQGISSFIPMTHSLEAFRLVILSGQGITSVSNHILSLSAWALIGLPISCLCFRFAVDRTRTTGTLGHY